MNPNKELLSLVCRVTPVADDPVKVELAKWLDARPEYDPFWLAPYPGPKGFTAWFHDTVLPRHAGERLRGAPKQKPWAAGQIVAVLANNLGNWLAENGFAKIGGRRVLIGQPDPDGPVIDEHETKATAARLHEWLATPVTYARIREDTRPRFRWIVWYDLAGCEPPLRTRDLEGQ